MACYGKGIMKNSSHNRRLINNELKTRAANQRVKRVIEHHTPQEEQEKLKIDFYCECSRADCQERVTMTLEDYEKIHADGAAFAIAPGHEAPTVERVKQKRGDIAVVEKYAL